jgi:uncharacterized protein
MGNVTALREARIDTGLEIAPGLRLPAEAVTETFALIANRGVGKSSTARVEVEEFHTAGLPVVVLDPKGDWWGLRYAADGEPGLPFVIFGGDHADVPLEPTAGPLLAEVIVSHRLSCVLDLSAMSKTAARQFACEFAEDLYRHNRDPIHVVIDEADILVPQRASADVARLLGAMEDLAKRGRGRGIGVTIITQRAADVSKTVLDLCETLIVLRVTGPRTRKAVTDWINDHTDDPDAIREVIGSLKELEVGEAWVWSPGYLRILRRIKVRPIRTFDSHATPKPGARRRRPTRPAKVDLAVLGERIAATVEHAQADDPRVLRRRIAELERELARARAAQPEPRVERVEVQVPVLDDELVGLLEAAVAPLFEVAEGIHHASDAIGEALSRWQHPSPGPPPPSPAASPPATASASRVARPSRARPAASGSGVLPKAQRAILTVLAQHPAGRTKRQLALQTGYAVKGGGFGNALGALRSGGLIERGEPVRATHAGRAALGDGWEPLPSGGQALLEHWAGQLGKAEGLILRALVAVWPGTLTKQEVADRTGYAADGGGFGNALGRLRTLELISGYRDLRADDALCS